MTLAARLGMQIALAKTAPALEYELVAEAIRERAGDEFERHVQAVLADGPANTDVAAGRARVAERARLLRQIPFRAILTTNFDASLRGGDANAWTYRRVLRDHHGRWSTFPTHASEQEPRVPILKLHGDANGDPEVAKLVLGRSDYRRRIYGDAGYTGFVRAAFASYTVLFLGVSFTDAYLNELRSETLSFLKPPSDGREPAWGYAILKIEPGQEGLPDLFRRHEGIHVLPIGELDEFDRLLAALTARTSIRGRLTQLLSDKTIVWIDAQPENNRIGRELFAACGARMIALTSEVELAPAHAAADLVITHFGHRGGDDVRAFRVLEALRGWPTRPPVIVFASPGDHSAANRRACLHRGAWEYATQWSELNRLIEVLLSRNPGSPGE